LTRSSSHSIIRSTMSQEIEKPHRTAQTREAKTQPFAFVEQERLYPTEREEREFREAKEKLGLKDSLVVKG